MTTGAPMQTQESHLIRRLELRLRTIQERHNFNPKYGARQISNCDDRTVLRAYAQFALILELIRDLGLDIPVPYDPCGLDPLGTLHDTTARTAGGAQ
jgi:hypothetical protein